MLTNLENMFNKIIHKPVTLTDNILTLISQTFVQSTELDKVTAIAHSPGQLIGTVYSRLYAFLMNY